VTGAGDMPWQNCHGYLLLLLILLIVALIVAAQLLWQYFVFWRKVPFVVQGCATISIARIDIKVVAQPWTIKVVAQPWTTNSTYLQNTNT
jgi:hypothetical protein